MENNKAMSRKDLLRQQLNAVKTAYDNDYGAVENTLEESMAGLKGRIAKFKLDLQEKAQTSCDVKAEPKYTKIAIADKAIETYKTNIRSAMVNPEVPELEKENIHVSTNASRHNYSAIARSLAGLRNGGNAGKMTQNTENGNGDLGQYTSPASSNGGDLGNNTSYGQYYSLTTNMTLEEYEEHINKKFLTEEPEVETFEIDDEYENELEESPVEDLKDELREMSDHSWQAIDKVMRKIAKEYDITPKELHKDFKAVEGMIPDEWAKINEQVQLCGYMPLDEATKIMKVGQVYEVSCIWRGSTMRLKFFWPEMGMPKKDEMQTACEMFYPGSRLLAFYPVKDNPDNFMVIVPPMNESYEFVPEDTWAELDEMGDAFYNHICEEVGEPVTPLVYHDNGEYHMMVEDHDTGDHNLITLHEEGLHAWFKNSRSKDGKPGWVNVVTGGTCASDKKGEGTPKCVSSAKRASMSKSERQSAARRKKAADPGQQSKTGAAKPTYVSTDKPKKEEYEPMDEACWKGYTKKGMKTMFGKRYPNCVKKTKSEEVEYIDEISSNKAGAAANARYRRANKEKDPAKKQQMLDKYDRSVEYRDKKHRSYMDKIAEGDEMKGMSQKSGDKRSTESGAGMTAQGVAKYNRRTGGNLKTAVTTPPSKLKPGSKAAKRRKSFCARSRGWTGERGKAARRRWNC